MVKVNKRNTHYHYYLKTPPDVEKVDLGHFQDVYNRLVDSLTQGFSERDWIDFYAKEDEFIENVAREFNKTRLSNYVLYTWNQDRINYLRNFIPDNLMGDVEDFASRFNS